MRHRPPTWTGLTLLDDSAHAVADEKTHKRRWQAWLYWSNVLQFLEHGGGDSAQLTTALLDGFTADVLTVTGGAGWLSSTRIVPATTDGSQREPESLPPVAVTTGLPAVPARTTEEAPSESRPKRDGAWDAVLEYVDPDEAGLAELAHALAELGVPAPEDGFELDEHGWQAELAWPHRPNRCGSGATGHARGPGHRGTGPRPCVRRRPLGRTAGGRVDGGGDRRPSRRQRRADTERPCRSRLAGHRHDRARREQERERGVGMTKTGGVTLRLLDKADKEILRLPRTVKGALFDFQHKFRHNPHTPGLKLKQLKGDSRLWSARVNDEYRALLLRLAEHDWLIVSVKHRKEVYDTRLVLPDQPGHRWHRVRRPPGGRGQHPATHSASGPAAHHPGRARRSPAPLRPSRCSPPGPTRS